MENNDLLRCILQVVGRMVIPPDRVRDIVGSGKKQLHAFNLCDGTHTQKQIAKESKIDQGQLSRTLTRWRLHGIVFVLDDANGPMFLHIYPMPPSDGRRKG